VQKLFSSHPLELRSGMSHRTAVVASKTQQISGSGCAFSGFGARKIAFCALSPKYISSRQHRGPNDHGTCVQDGRQSPWFEVAPSRRFLIMTDGTAAAPARINNDSSRSSLSDAAVVSTLLGMIKTSDGGPSTTPAVREEIDSVVYDLCKRGEGQTTLSDPRLVGNYNVLYTSSRQKRPPAGGVFRGKLGRLLFRSRGLFQHIISPDIVVNLVAFRFLGLIPGAVGLKGVFSPIPDDEIGPNAIKVEFMSPRIRLGKFVFALGSPDVVRIRTTYLDDRVRIGIGSRGSLFVFSRGGQADESIGQEWQYMFSDATKPLPFALVPLALLAPIVLILRLMFRGVQSFAALR
jgi:PAP_fibrillin